MLCIRCVASDADSEKRQACVFDFGRFNHDIYLSSWQAAVWVANVRYDKCDVGLG